MFGLFKKLFSFFIFFQIRLLHFNISQFVWTEVVILAFILKYNIYIISDLISLIIVLEYFFGSHLLYSIASVHS